MIENFRGKEYDIATFIVQTTSGDYNIAEYIISADSDIANH